MKKMRKWSSNSETAWAIVVFILLLVLVGFLWPAPAESSVKQHSMVEIREAARNLASRCIYPIPSKAYMEACLVKSFVAELLSEGKTVKAAPVPTYAPSAQFPNFMEKWRLDNEIQELLNQQAMILGELSAARMAEQARQAMENARR